MAIHLTLGWEEKSWAENYGCFKGAAQKVVMAASHDRTMIVFSQCAAQWSIRMLPEQKQRSSLRASKQKQEPIEISEQNMMLSNVNERSVE